MTAAEVAAALRRYRYVYANEADLQAGLAEALASEGLLFEREVRLNDRDRIDFLVGPRLLLGGQVGIEVKVRGGRNPLLHQLQRYAGSPDINGLVVVTNRAGHYLPTFLNGKPVEVVQLVLRL